MCAFLASSHWVVIEFLIQPGVPIALPWEAVPLMITRLTVPYVATPDLGSPEHRKHGIGDTTLLAIVNPKLPKGNAGGLGVSLVFATAGDNDFTGSGKWQAGPAAVYINTETSTQWGLFGFQNWSFANARSNSEGVSKLSIQPILTHHFGGGWFVGSPDNPQVYDFKTDKWTLQLGPQVGRVFKLGSQPVKLFGAVYHNLIDDNGPTAKIGLTFLFPE